MRDPYGDIMNKSNEDERYDRHTSDGITNVVEKIFNFVFGKFVRDDEYAHKRRVKHDSIIDKHLESSLYHRSYNESNNSNYNSKRKRNRR